MKTINKVLLASFFLTGTAFSQSIPEHLVQSCETKGNLIECKIVEKSTFKAAPKSNQYAPAPLNSSTPSATAPIPLTAAAAAAVAESITKGQKPPEGKYESVPGGNVFVFCSGPRPPKKSPWRSVYDRICPEGQPTPAAPADLPTSSNPPQPPQLNLIK